MIRRSTPHIQFRKWVVSRVVYKTPKLSICILGLLSGQSWRGRETLQRWPVAPGAVPIREPFPVTVAPYVTCQ